MAELTQRQWATVVAGRKALRETIARDYPNDLVPLLVVAITGQFADICAASAAKGDLIHIINGQLRDAGLELRPLRRN